MALFKRNKENRKKGAETTIGKIIYGFLLFMPLFSIGARCLYVILNKNAYQSYADSNLIETTVKPTNVNQIVNGTQIIFTYGENTNYNGDYTLCYGYSSLSFNPNDYGFTPNRAFKYIQFFYTSNNYYVYLYETSTSYERQPILQTLERISIIATGDNINGAYPLATRFLTTQIISFQTSKLDNVFEYSINQTQESNIYNWAKQTGTYTVLHNTTTGLGITNEFIPMLMAYWLIISVIYFLFDIALILIWAVHKKIHELSEAI